MLRASLIGVVIVGLVAGACQRQDKDKQNKSPGSGVSRVDTGSGAPRTPPRTSVEQIPAPETLKQPPADATKTATGLIYKKLTSNDNGSTPGRNDTVQILYTGWKQATGETFYTTKTRGQPIPLPLATSAPGFSEGLQLLKKGEKIMLWIPPEIGYKQPPANGKAETLVYEVELVDITPAPAIPQDVAAAPANAQTLKSGAKYVVVRAGTGTDKARPFDTVTFNYTGWDHTGKMFDSTEVRKRPATVPPYRQPPVLEEVLTSMVAGERVRVWFPASSMQTAGKAIPGAPTDTLCYEIELLQIEKAKAAPPPVPTDVAAPPATAKKTAKGVFYKYLGDAKSGPKPTANDTVKVNYTGWKTDGHMIDSSIIKGEPAEFSLGGVIAGWTDGIQVMSVGDKVRFWIPEELAYKGNPSRPQGMLVFDIELLSITAGAAQPGKLPPPADVAAPPKDALKSPKGVFYKILSQGKGGPHPAPADVVKVDYTGWTTDGEMFDSSVVKGQPLEYPLNRLVDGWVDAFQLLSVGDKARLWIPQELAYKGQPGAPAGMLVFDVELLGFKPAMQAEKQ